VECWDYLFDSKLHYMKYILKQTLLFIASIISSILIAELYFLFLSFSLTWLTTFGSVILLILLYVMAAGILSAITMLSATGMTFLAVRIKVNWMRLVAIVFAVVISLGCGVYNVFFCWRDLDSSISIQLITGILITLASLLFIIYTIIGGVFGKELSELKK
jgi:hypothetical protein